jgi:hypothetical protein
VTFTINLLNDVRNHDSGLLVALRMELEGLAVVTYLVVDPYYCRILSLYQGRSQNFENRLLASSCLSAHVSVCMRGTLGSHWTDFHEI